MAAQQAVLSVSNSINALASVFAINQQDCVRSGAHNPPIPATPQHRTSAIQCLSQIDHNLSVRTHSTVIALFQDNIAAVDTYMALDPADTELRRVWMRNLLVEHYPSAEFKDLIEREDM